MKPVIGAAAVIARTDCPTHDHGLGWTKVARMARQTSDRPAAAPGEAVLNAVNNSSTSAACLIG